MHTHPYLWPLPVWPGRLLRSVVNTFGGWKLVTVSSISLVAGFLFSGALMYPLARANARQTILNRDAIVLIHQRDATVAAGIVSMQATQRARDDWQELQICATQSSPSGANAVVLTYSLTAELRERCKAAAERLARRY